MHVESNPVDRSTKVDEWVELQALMIVAEGGWAGDSPWLSLVDTIDTFDSPVIRRLRQLLGGELYAELWPTDEATYTDEYDVAHSRAMLLALRMFERLQVRHAENVDHLAGQAAKTLERLSPPEAVISNV